jgi:hypothetical protein
MPRDGSMTFGDLIGQLEHLEIACPKCDRLGRYSVRRLAMQYGAQARRPVGRRRGLNVCFAPKGAKRSDGSQGLKSAITGREQVQQMLVVPTVYLAASRRCPNEKTASRRSLRSPLNVLLRW